MSVVVDRITMALLVRVPLCQLSDALAWLTPMSDNDLADWNWNFGLASIVFFLMVLLGRES